MADYEATARTNRFAVKDPKKFKRDMAALFKESETHAEVKEEDGKFLILFYGPPPGYLEFDPPVPKRKLPAAVLADGVCWDKTVIRGGDGSEVVQELSFDFHCLLAQYLADGEVAILTEIGHEGMKYLIGKAVAIDNKGQEVTIDINDICPLAAAKFGVPLEKITKPEY
jgi:hypothetical protein